MRNAMLINEKDNVIVAIEPLSKGTNAVYQVNGRSEEIKVLEDIPMYHKIARVPIKAGSEIIKYGEYIGEAACDIPAGSYVHTHNGFKYQRKESRLRRDFYEFFGAIKDQMAR